MFSKYNTDCIESLHVAGWEVHVDKTTFSEQTILLKNATH